MAMLSSFELDDIDFNLDSNFLSEMRVPLVSPTVTQEFNVEDERYGEYLAEEMEKRLFVEEQQEQENRESEEDIDIEADKKLLMELFGEDLSEDESEQERFLKPEMKKSLDTLVNLIDEKRGLGAEEIDEKKLLEQLNEAIEPTEKFEIEFTPKTKEMKQKKNIRQMLQEELSQDEILKMLGDDKINEQYIKEVMEDREKFPLSEEFIESESETEEEVKKTEPETIQDKFISNSFEEKLEKVKDEIEKIDKSVKKRIKKVVTCPEGKEINPKTGKCINKCKTGYERNPETGKCIKIKAKK